LDENTARKGSATSKKKVGPNIRSDAAKKLHEMAYTRLKHPSFNLIGDEKG
jgi:hypothetical protein